MQVRMRACLLARLPVLNIRLISSPKHSKVKKRLAEPAGASGGVTIEAFRQNLSPPARDSNGPCLVMAANSGHLPLLFNFLCGLK
jgi:hypothetical protein